jgi:hypothetical protein
MGIIFTFVFAFFLGYIYGYRIKPNRRLREKIREVRDRYKAILEEGRQGVYKTIVMDENKSSELVVEVKELAVTELGQVKVQYLSAFYKNPEFRTRKGEALLNEVNGLLGDFLPLHEIEWYETDKRDEKIRDHLHSFERKYKNHFSV